MPWSRRQGSASVWLALAGERCSGAGDEVPRHGENRPRRRPQGGVRVAR
jgi:hypothetical protein